MSNQPNRPSSEMPTRPRYEKPVLQVVPVKEAVHSGVSTGLDPTNCLCAFES